MWTYSVTCLVCQSSSEPKILLYSVSMSSAIWFWYTICIAMFPVSSSALRRVGPNTIPRLWVDMRFLEALATILERDEKRRFYEFEVKLWLILIDKILCSWILYLFSISISRKEIRAMIGFGKTENATQAKHFSSSRKTATLPWHF